MRAAAEKTDQIVVPDFTKPIDQQGLPQEIQNNQQELPQETQYNQQGLPQETQYNQQTKPAQTTQNTQPTSQSAPPTAPSTTAILNTNKQLWIAGMPITNITTKDQCLAAADAFRKANNYTTTAQPMVDPQAWVPRGCSVIRDNYKTFWNEHPTGSPDNRRFIQLRGDSVPQTTKTQAQCVASADAFRKKHNLTATLAPRTFASETAVPGCSISGTGYRTLWNTSTIGNYNNAGQISLI
jgi:hypothetical protein